jgi:uncharacterized membrane protein (UPF0127 family)
MSRLPVLVLALGLLVPAACTQGESQGSHASTATILFGDPSSQASLGVEIADTPDEREQGLMGREHLPEDLGIVFLFEEPTTARFWMKDTLIPLSIAFYDDDRVVAILDMPPCHADPCPTYGPAVPYVGAVEANEGWFARSGVEVGDRVELIT